MGTVVNKVQESEEITSFSKHEQLVQGVINAIDERIVTQGSMYFFTIIIWKYLKPFLEI